MKNSHHSIDCATGARTSGKKFLILAQFFLIIFVYHILKDLKDTLVITSSDAGAMVIPFIKIWVILPFAVLASYLFARLYQWLGREKTLYCFVTVLLSAYLMFAFCLYPLRESLYLSHLSQSLTVCLPVGCKGFITMVSYWIYTLFYLSAELWGMMILTVLFWGYLNETTPIEQAKSFYPLCVLTGNCASIVSGLTSRYICHTLIRSLSWQTTMQLMISIVAICGIAIMGLHYCLARGDELTDRTASSLPKKSSPSISFKESILCITRSTPLFCIALIVAGFALTSNLVEVVWKETIKSVYPVPAAYNAYVNQLTSLIGVLAVITSLFSRKIFQTFKWSQIALIGPVVLFFTSLTFFVSLQAPDEWLSPIATLVSSSSLYVIMTLGSVYYVAALVTKYTIFDVCKDMAFLSIEPTERMRAKAVIDSVGSRLGKSGSSCLYQVLWILFGSSLGLTPIIGTIAIGVIGASVIATRLLGKCLEQEKTPSLLESDLASIN